MNGTSSRGEMLQFMQRCQVAAGECLPGTAMQLRLVASCRALWTVPSNAHPTERALIARIISRLAHETLQERRASPRERSWQKPCDAVSQLAELFREADTKLQVVASRSGYSRWHLCRQLRSATGLTFTQLLHGARLLEAIRLLSGTSYSVKEIAAKTGYRTSGELNRKFNTVLHVSPTTFRRSLRPAFLSNI